MTCDGFCSLSSLHEAPATGAAVELLEDTSETVEIIRLARLITLSHPPPENPLKLLSADKNPPDSLPLTGLNDCHGGEALLPILAAALASATLPDAFGCLIDYSINAQFKQRHIILNC